MSDDKALIARLDALETSLAYQEQTIEDLNAALVGQEKEMAQLRRDVARMTEQLSSIGGHPALASNDEPPPPHY